MQCHSTPDRLERLDLGHAAVKLDDEELARFGTKAAWRSQYRRGAEEILDRLRHRDGFGDAIREADVGFRRVLGLPPRISEEEA